MGRSADHSPRVVDLIRAGHTVVWECEVCRRRGPADLVAIERARGPNFTLGNRRPRCRQADCAGRVRFRLLMGLWHRDLDTISARDETWWRYNEDERARLLAEGYRIWHGQWLAPGTEAK